jgi:glycosyltransferase involved in cell wall biosynthesis
MITEQPSQTNRLSVSNPFSYVVISPARNEAAFIERTLLSVTSQTVLPLKWVIVSDGSTDATNEIVRKYADRYNWIELIELPPRDKRHFAGKVHAFNAGFSVVRSLNYDAIASLDADISFDSGYFEFLLEQLAKDSRLGLVGTPFAENGRSYDYRFVSIEHVSGACQVFRRECFEAIGGYIPREAGGIDHVAVITARMKGWKTRTFTEKTCGHHRKIGSANQGILKSRFRDGALDYALGGNAFWELFRAVYQMSKRPLVIGGLMIFVGYFSSLFRGTPRAVSPEIVRFRRHEQMARLRQFFAKTTRTVSPALTQSTGHAESRSQ